MTQNSELRTGQVCTFKVLDLEENYDHFSGSGGNLKHCHKFIMEFEGKEVDCQICTDSPTQNFCSKGDTVQAKLGKLSRNQWTLENIIRIPERVPSPPTGSNVEKLKRHNILLQGSAATIAITQAVSFVTQHSRMPGTDVPEITDVLSAADKIYDWLLDKNDY